MVDLVQIRNPKSGHYMKIDKDKGRIVSYKKTKGPYKNIPIVLYGSEKENNMEDEFIDEAINEIVDEVIEEKFSEKESGEDKKEGGDQLFGIEEKYIEKIAFDFKYKCIHNTPGYCRECYQKVRRG